MGTQEIELRSAANSQHCRCGHNQRHHELPGFGGECSGCDCGGFRSTARAVAQRHQPGPISPAERRLVASWTDEIVAEIDARPHRHVSANGDWATRRSTGGSAS